MSLQILILGGTGDAARLAAGINADPKFWVTTSRAGRTDNPKKLAGKVRVGGFGGIAGLIDYLLESKIDVLVDASHAFAAQIRRHDPTVSPEAARTRAHVLFGLLNSTPHSGRLPDPQMHDVLRDMAHGALGLS